MITIEQARALTGHTKGPWHWSDTINSNTWSLCPGVYEACRGDTDATPGGDEIDQANARLIAAAPDLLALALAQADEIEQLRDRAIFGG